MYRSIHATIYVMLLTGIAVHRPSLVTFVFISHHAKMIPKKKMKHSNTLRKDQSVLV